MLCKKKNKKNKNNRNSRRRTRTPPTKIKQQQTKSTITTEQNQHKRPSPSKLTADRKVFIKTAWAIDKCPVSRSQIFFLELHLHRFPQIKHTKYTGML
jgi:hypothetical protein